MKKIYTLLGFIIIVTIWQLICLSGVVTPLLFPSPLKVITSFKELWWNDFLLSAALYSIKLNVLGYIQAIAVALPLGFLLGLSPQVRMTFSKYIDALRYVPLTATTGLFICYFGIDDLMKIQFLSFGIFIFLLPVVVTRIDEVEKVYTDTVYTLGATKWETIRTVFIPSVVSRVSDDIRVLVSLSWTYIVVAELVNKTNGLGALTFTASRQSRIDKVFFILLLIIVIGIVQDRLFVYLDKKIFPYKYINRRVK